MSLDPNMCRIEFIIASILLPKVRALECQLWHLQIFASPITMCDEFASFSCDIDSLAEGHAHPLQWTRCIPREKRCDGFKDCFSGIVSPFFYLFLESILFLRMNSIVPQAVFQQRRSVVMVPAFQKTIFVMETRIVLMERMN